MISQRTRWLPVLAVFVVALLIYGLTLTLSAAALMVVNCANIRENIRDAQEYTRANKIALGTMVLFEITDAYTTATGIDAGAKELHPAIVGKPDTGTILILSAVRAAGKWFFGHLMPPNWRNWFWGGAAVASTGFTINNYKVWKKQEEASD